MKGFSLSSSLPSFDPKNPSPVVMKNLLTCRLSLRLTLFNHLIPNVILSTFEIRSSCHFLNRLVSHLDERILSKDRNVSGHPLRGILEHSYSEDPLPSGPIWNKSNAP